MKKLLLLFIASLSLMSCSEVKITDYSKIYGNNVSQREFLDAIKNVKYKPSTHHIAEYKIETKLNVIAYDTNGSELTNGLANIVLTSEYVKEDGYFSNTDYTISYDGTFPLLDNDGEPNTTLTDESSREEYMLLLLLFGRTSENNQDFVYQYTENSGQQINYYVNPYQVEYVEKEDNQIKIRTLANYDKKGIRTSYYFETFTDGLAFIINDEIVNGGIKFISSHKIDTVVEKGSLDDYNNE